MNRRISRAKAGNSASFGPIAIPSQIPITPNPKETPPAPLTPRALSPERVRSGRGRARSIVGVGYADKRLSPSLHRSHRATAQRPVRGPAVSLPSRHFAYEYASYSSPGGMGYIPPVVVQPRISLPVHLRGIPAPCQVPRASVLGYRGMHVIGLLPPRALCAAPSRGGIIEDAPFTEEFSFFTGENGFPHPRRPGASPHPVPPGR